MILLSHLLLKLKSILASTWSDPSLYNNGQNKCIVGIKHLKIKADM